MLNKDTSIRFTETFLKVEGSLFGGTKRNHREILVKTSLKNVLNFIFYFKDELYNI